MLVLAVPLLVGSVIFSSRGSLRAQFVWLGCLAYLAYNAVMFCFAPHFNALFLLFTTWLALSFWALLTLLPTFEHARVGAATAFVPVRTVAIYLLTCSAVFALLWLQAIVPAVLGNTMPAARGFGGAGPGV